MLSFESGEVEPQVEYEVELKRLSWSDNSEKEGEKGVGGVVVMSGEVY